MRSAVIAGAGVGALLLGACSDGATKPVAGNEPSRAAVAPADHEVAIKDFLFVPTPVKVAVGSTITWTNEDSALHSVVSRPGELFASEDMTQGQTFQFTAAEAGTITYICGIHNYMTGEIVVS